MSLPDFLGALFVGIIAVPLSIYFAARLIFSAFFFTKQQYEKRKHHGRPIQ